MQHTIFNKPIEINFGSVREDLAIYQRENGVIWKELPSLNRNGQILTFTENAGYFRLGPKTIIVPEETDLHQNYPNPFNHSTVIKYSISHQQHLTLKILNIVGQEVASLIDEEQLPGDYSITWNGRDASGHAVNTGIYYYRLKSFDNMVTRKMLLLK